MEPSELQINHVPTQLDREAMLKRIEELRAMEIGELVRATGTAHMINWQAEAKATVWIVTEVLKAGIA